MDGETFDKKKMITRKCIGKCGTTFDCYDTSPQQWCSTECKIITEGFKPGQSRVRVLSRPEASYVKTGKRGKNEARLTYPLFDLNNRKRWRDAS
jgi:hypothetical protein